MPFFFKKFSQDQIVIIALLAALLTLIPVNIFIISRYIPNNTKTLTNPSLLPASSQEQRGSLPTQMQTLKNTPNQNSLSTSDKAAKNNLLFTILHGEQSGIIYESPTVRVEYVRGADIFQAEIFTENISKAKDEAASIFYNYGISHEGICALPLRFYLNRDLQNNSEKTLSLNPLPPGC